MLGLAVEGARSRRRFRAGVQGLALETLLTSRAESGGDKDGDAANGNGDKAGAPEPADGGACYLTVKHDRPGGLTLKSYCAPEAHRMGPDEIRIPAGSIKGSGEPEKGVGLVKWLQRGAELAGRKALAERGHGAAG